MHSKVPTTALLAGLLAAQASFAATYYVDASAAKDSGNGSQASPKKYIQSGISLMSSRGGDTLIIAPGTYSNRRDAIVSPTRGKAGAYNVIKAATDGSVILKGAFELGAGDHYLRFEGLKFDQQDVKVILGRYVKIMRCAFKGGPPIGNNVTLQIGTNDNTPGAQYILVEDSWVYGPGGRYKILVYNSDRIVLRRVLVRHDGGWLYDGSNPQAGIAIYDSTNVELQNGIVIDSMPGLPAFESNIYLVANGTTSQRAGNVAVRGSIVLGGGGNGIAWDGSAAYSNSLLEDVVVWGSSAGGIASNGSPNVGTITRATVKSGGTGFADWDGGSRLAISSSIAYQNSNSACDGVNASHSVSFGNGSDNCGTAFDPTTNGLKYILRVEPGSRLSAAGANGGHAGANIVKRIGVGGTLYGETGYDQVTDEDLWPWPNETRIKTDLAEGNSRGFSASSKTLTNYLWEILGNPSPVTSR
ncbi:MAG TPA: hypothetical protein VFV88_01405 [Steroidobacteraceae bacterium]|nr:hypothetical protein [Steroidobacteraceae bacterium]